MPHATDEGTSLLAAARPGAARGTPPSRRRLAIVRRLRRRHARRVRHPRRGEALGVDLEGVARGLVAEVLLEDVWRTIARGQEAKRVRWEDGAT